MIDIIIAVLKLIGLGNWLNKFITVRQAKKQAQETADAPQTIKEEEDYFK